MRALYCLFYCLHVANDVVFCINGICTVVVRNKLWVDLMSFINIKIQ